MSEENNNFSLATIEEQERLGIRRPVQNKFVPALPNTQINLPAQTSTVYSVDAIPNAQLGSITRTNATDKAKGYLLIQTPIALIMAILILATAKALAGFPLLSFAAFLVFWITFAAVWLIGWGITLFMSAEGVAFYEARRKWNIVESEQVERWDYYKQNLESDRRLPVLTDQPIVSKNNDLDWRLIISLTLALWAMIILAWILTK